jgi:hypothetical protein
MSLQDWLKNNWVTEHKTSCQEIADLLGVADRDLKDCNSEGLSADWKLNIAYNAALQAATAALAAAGYRAARDAHHYRIIQSLAHTTGTDTKLILQFERFRKKRNIGGYERAGTVSDAEANEMIALARTLREQIEYWIRINYPDLI